MSTQQVSGISSASTVPPASASDQGRPIVAKGRDDLVGKELCGRIIVDGVLAQGGMARLYTGYDTHFAQRCVIKVSQSYDERLSREWRIALRIQHIPGVVAAYDTYFLDDGKTPFIVFEYVKGETLRQILARGTTLHPTTALRIALQIASILDNVHQMGIVHRDLSDANVMVKEDGEVVVIDFGLAYVVGAPALTKPDTVLGTPTYMSPEQRIPQHPVTPKMDVYALGILLYRMLAERQRVEALGTLAGIDERRRHIRASLPSSLASLADVIARATCREEEKRIATMTELAMALAAAHDVSRLHEAAPHVALQFQKSRARRRERRLVGVMAGVCTVALGLVLWFHHVAARPPAPPTPPPASSAMEAREESNKRPTTTTEPPAPLPEASVLDKWRRQ